MELTKQQTSQLHDIEPAIWETLHDLQNELYLRETRWEESAYREKFRFATKINEMRCPVMVYNVKLGCYTLFVNMETGNVGQPTDITVIGVEYPKGWNIDDCLFFYEQDGYKICEGVDGFIRKKLIYQSGHTNTKWHISHDLIQELYMVSIIASSLSFSVAQNIGGEFLRINECKAHEVEIQRLQEHIENIKEKFYTSLREADVEVF